ncbi:MAG: hypothetical protein IJ243_03430 [Prevotella sp.]|nr:hypothetical protein [Prevotella sp.]
MRGQSREGPGLFWFHGGKLGWKTITAIRVKKRRRQQEQLGQLFFMLIRKKTAKVVSEFLLILFRK